MVCRAPEGTMDFPFAPLHQGMVRRKVHGLAVAQRTVAVTPERGRLLLVLERREVVEIVGKRVPRRIHGMWRTVTDDAAHHEHIVAASAEEVRTAPRLWASTC